MSDREWAVVTGASGGLGKAFAARLAHDGLNVVLAARNTAAMQRTAAVLASLEGKTDSSEVFALDTGPGLAARRGGGGRRV